MQYIVLIVWCILGSVLSRFLADMGYMTVYIQGYVFGLVASLIMSIND